MKRILFLIMVMLVTGCGGASGGFVPGRQPDWQTDGMSTDVTRQIVDTYALMDLSETNDAQPVQRRITTYSTDGDRLKIEYFQTPLYDKLQKNKYAGTRKGDYRLYKKAETVYEYQRREKNYFISSHYISLNGDETVKWEQEWIYSPKAQPIGESYFYETEKGMETYFLSFGLDEKGFIISEEYTGEYRGNHESYTRFIQNDALGRPTNSVQIVGNLTNRKRWTYNLNGRVASIMEIDALRQLLAAEVYNNFGHVLTRTIVDNKGKKTVYEYFYEYDTHGNVSRSWVMVSVRKKAFQPLLQSYSYQTMKYQY